MAKKKGLGRGLDALLGGDSEAQMEQESETGLLEVPLDELKPGRFQPRKDMDQEALEALSASIRSQGVVQPIAVRADGDHYEIIAGERRWRAARMAGLKTVPVIIREVDDNTAMAVALIENIQREDLNPLEEAMALQRLIKECKLTHQQCAESVGKSRASVSNLIRLLDLDPVIQDLVRDRRLEMGHARAILSAPREGRVKLAHLVIAKGLSVRQTEVLARGKEEIPESRNKPVKNHYVLGLEETVGGFLGTKVRINANEEGSGSMVIHFDSHESLNKIARKLSGDY